MSAAPKRPVDPSLPGPRIRDREHFPQQDRDMSRVPKFVRRHA
jgi:hypothetical protein